MTDQLDALALRLESDAHRRGWDGDPALFVVYEHADVVTEVAYANILAAPTRVGPYAARYLVPPQRLGPQPQHAVFRLALNLRYATDAPEVAELLEGLRQPGFVGMAMLCEGWLFRGTDEEMAARGNRSLADTPGSVENRIVMLALPDGGLRIVQRIRGEKPELLVDWHEGVGAVPESLLVIAAVIADKPAPELTHYPVGWQEEGTAQ